MKKHLLLLAAVAFLITCSLLPLEAALSDATSSQSYLVAGMAKYPPETLYDGGPKQWSFGVYYQDQKRDFNFGSAGVADEVNVQHLLTFVGYDVVPWLTVFHTPPVAAPT